MVTGYEDLIESLSLPDQDDRHVVAAAIHVDFPEGRRQVPVLLITWAWSNRTFAIALPSEKVEANLIPIDQLCDSSWLIATIASNLTKNSFTPSTS